MREVARAAQVSVETVYSSVGAKTDLLKVCLDVAVVGDDEPIPLADRPEFQALGEGAFEERAAAVGRLLAGLHHRNARLRRVLEQAAAADHDLTELVARSYETERESFRQGIAAVLGREPRSQDVDALRAVLGHDVYVILVDVSSWTDEQFAGWVGDTIVRLLDPTPQGD
jgi:AcrR family transcriptional regulator